MGNIYGDNMNIKNFYNEYNIDEEDENFLPSRIFESDLKASGWKIKESLTLANFHRKFNDLKITCSNPNFYSDGQIIAESRKSIIQACGHPIIKYDNKEFWEIGQLVRIYGDKVIADMKNWTWVQDMDWIVVTKKENKLLAQFNKWENLPIRKEVE
jgi:hypothetical protein|tara:strand:+ start:60 stop:527 length:468 start_codon:yes stop_codon:yes gene_type:complete